MEPKLLTFCIFCAIFCGLSFEAAAKGVTCEFDVKKVVNNLSFVYNDYACKIKSFDLSGSDVQTVIEGVHQAGKSDDDVKIVYCWNCTTAAVPILDINFCQKFPNLEAIQMNRIQIEQIDPQIFQNCQNLKYLDLGDNKIREIPENLLAELPKLIFLSFIKNQISSIAANAFKNQKELQTLRLGGNQLTSLPPKVFEPLSYLKKLQLGDNQLTTIHSDSFGFHWRLREVDFWDNKIDAIDEKFIENTAFEVLHMERNICYGDWIYYGRSDIKEKLKKCFDNYQPRPSTTTTSKSTSRASTQSTTKATPKPTTSRTLAPKTTTRSAVTTWTQLIISSTTSKPITSEADTAACGKSKSAQGNIIGGSFAAKGDFPWLAALIKEGKFFCSGTLISDKKVVSAAHCIHVKYEKTRLYPKDVRVLLGMHDLNDTFEPKRRTSEVWDIHIHPKWNPGIRSYDADISVLVMEEKVRFSNRIQPICLIEPGSAVASLTSGIVVGYGRSEDESKEHENIPKIIDVPIHDQLECFFTFPDLLDLSSRNTFCGGHANGTGVCEGDSGSGMVVKYEGIYYLRGIVSSSLRDHNWRCDVDSYSVYTDILKYRSFIDEIDVQGDYYQKAHKP